MKKSLITLAIALLILPQINAGQLNHCREYKIVGFSMYHFSSGSGFDQSLNLSASIERSNRHLEAGVIMQLGSGRLSGGEMLYRHYLSPVYKRFGQQNNVRFYFQHNLIFREQLLINDSGVIPAPGPQNSVDAKKVPTFEQYAGFGALLRVHNNLFVNANAGYGIIMGSADNYLAGSTCTGGRMRCNHGMAVKFGLGYFFKR